MQKSTEFKNHIAGIFSRASLQYGKIGPDFFTFTAEKLVEFTEVSKNAKILDVACGRGAIIYSSLERISQLGEIVGIDLADGMVEYTKNELMLKEIKNVQVIKMDAENLKFPDNTFDYVFCGLGLFFFPNIEKALMEMYRVLNPGGVFAASTLKNEEKEQDIEIVKQWIDLHESIKESLKPIPNYEAKRLDNEDEINQALEKAGFEQINVIEEKTTFYYQDEKEWWESMWSHGYRNYLERMDTETLAIYKNKSQKLILLEKTEHGIPHYWHLLLSKAIKPKL